MTLIDLQVVNMPAFGKMNKGELTAALQALGEVPPETWTLTELRVRLADLEVEQGIHRNKGQVLTDYQGWVQKLNRASKKKDTLQVFCSQDLKMMVSPNATMMELQHAAMDKIYQVSVATGMDAMGFGQYASKTYMEVYTHHPSYTDWTIRTMEEGEHGNLLGRYARWAQQEKKNPTMPALTPPAIKTKVNTKTGSSSSPPPVDETQAMMLKMVEAITALKNDVDSMKEERPRKKKESEESFSMLSEATS